MRHPYRLLTACLLACTLATSVPSCAGMITKQDAAEIGASLANSSLDLAAAYLAGQDIDLKKEAIILGVSAADKAISKVMFNVSNGSNATPQDVVSNAGQIAEARITGTAVEDPAVAAKAREIAAEAVSVATVQLAAPPAGGSDK